MNVNAKKLSVIIALFLFSRIAGAMEPTWAKKATAFSGTCFDKKDYPKCKSVEMKSPDGLNTVEVLYRRDPSGDGYVLSPFLRVTTPEKGRRETTVPWGFGAIDLLWSSDSKAFFLNGDNGGAYWGFWVYVYLVDNDVLEPIEVTQNAQREMIKAFPPCMAIYLDSKECKQIEEDPGYNMSGIDWLDGSHSLLVMAEVPCAGSYGGTMCQVMGYEVEIPSGKILKTLDARSLKRHWQRSMAFKFHVPDPPNYRRKSTTSER